MMLVILILCFIPFHAEGYEADCKGRLTRILCTQSVDRSFVYGLVSSAPLFSDASMQVRCKDEFKQSVFNSKKFRKYTYFPFSGIMRCDPDQTITGIDLCFEGYLKYVAIECNTLQPGFTLDDSTDMAGNSKQDPTQAICPDEKSMISLQLNKDSNREINVRIGCSKIVKSPSMPSNAATKPTDCAELLLRCHNTSGVYTIWPRSRVSEDRPLEVFCDMDTDGGGWTVLQRRGDFSRPNDYFYKDWANYKKGFGDVEKAFWLGNDNIFALTNQRLNSIRFDLKAVDGEKRYAFYDKFWIDDENNAYTLHINDYSGDAGDSMSDHHDNHKFTTRDRDNDYQRDQNCAQKYKGAWWYDDCLTSNLNGLYLKGAHDSFADGVNWKGFKGYHESLDTSEMKIRPKNFRKNLVTNKIPRGCQ